MDNTTQLVNQINQLPPDVQLQVLDYVEFLSQKYIDKDCLKLSSEERRSLEKCLGVSPGDNQTIQRKAVLTD
ncbi:MAG TPA: hypothetical protein DCS93_37080 [Microscillaceae bacterium]|nr:hypothetical protein [Microscillaceae bacterium]